MLRKSTWTLLTTLVLILTILGIGSASPLQDFASLKKQAEIFYQEKSYARAHSLYQETQRLGPPVIEKRWVAFRLADTLWRKEAATNNPDTTQSDQARTQLLQMVRDINRKEDKDRIWAEVQESLGHFEWTRRQGRNWGSAWQYYQKALDWWAGAKDLELARTRYINIIWTITSPPWRDRYYIYGNYGNQVPLNFLENVLKIAKTPSDKHRAQYLIAMSLRNQGGWNQIKKVGQAFENSLREGKLSDWYDDALYHYAEWLAHQGEVVILKGGQKRRQQNYVKALQYYRRILNEFKKGETRYFKDAKRKVQQITKPTLNVSVSNIFLPGSETQVQVNWRNLKRVEFNLYQVDLTEDVKPEGNRSSYQAMLQQVQLDSHQRVSKWSIENEDQGDHQPKNRMVRIEDKLKPGAYVLVASNGSLNARELILVTDSALVLKTSKSQALVYFADSADGSPITEARVRLWEKFKSGKHWKWKSHTATTNAEGLAVFELLSKESHTQYFTSARLGDRQSFATGNHYHYQPHTQQWKIYVTTDRPAYRPNEAVQWKLTARTQNNSTYGTPSGSKIVYEIRDPRGAKLKEDEIKLNAFGSAWGSLQLSKSIPLGAYQIRFWAPGKKKNIGNATLFRLEEYKLPEYKVSVNTPEQDGQKKVFLSGETVEVNIDAEYYFGGPVSDASVEVLVYQKTFQPYWQPTPDFPWYYRDIYSPPHSWGQGQQIKREVIKTNAEGKAKLIFNTPDNGQNMEYRIEARVTDSSRREVRGSGTVRVAPKKFFAYLTPKHHLYQPQDKVTVDLKTVDANQQPVTTEGTIKITRQTWREIWLDSKGKEVTISRVQKRHERRSVLPPPHKREGWKLKFRGYDQEDILTRSIKTDAQGETEISFTPGKEGYYQFAFHHEDGKTPPINTSTTVWVATNATTDLGYRHGGLQMIVDKDTFRAGQPAPVMLVVPTNDRYVLFSVETEDLQSYQLVHVTGTVKLVTLDITEQHVPNVFLSGVMINDHKIFQDNKQIVVPPVKQFLTVNVETDRPRYGPREKATLTVSTKDHEGKPVSSEVSLGLVDESVYAIQDELAQDPRQFFYETKRSHQVRTTSTFQIKRYVQLEEGEDKELRESSSRRDEALRGRIAGQAGAFGSGVTKEASNAPMPASLADESVASFAEADASSEGKIYTGGRIVSKKALMRSKAPAEVSGEAGAPVQVRSDFRTTVFWKPDVRTNSAGTATVEVTFPDSLTEWRATARAVAKGNRFGQAVDQTHTQKPLIVRLQAPRFFVVGDEVTLSANINNNTEQALTVSPALNVDGVDVLGRWVDDKIISDRKQSVSIPAKGQMRIDWRILATQPGNVKLKVIARGGKLSDAMEKTFIAHEHGIEKFIAHSGKLKSDSATATLNLPKARKAGTTEVQVQVTPSLAVTMLDALPYLIDFPYGCTEQTLSRFMPTVVVSDTLRQLGLKPEDVLARVFGGIDPEHTGKTHRGGPRDLKQLTRMVDQGLERLTDFQHSDNGWGWWKKGDSDPFMSAYVLWGLTLAAKAGQEVNLNIMTRAYNYLTRVLVKAENDYALQAFELHASTAYAAEFRKGKFSKFERKAFENLWKHRARLNAYTLALLTLTAHQMGNEERAQTLIRNLENGVIEDAKPDQSAIQRGENSTTGSVTGTAHWGEDGIFYRWSEGGVEATAFALQALLTVAPEHRLIEPVVQWLIKNRRGAHWSNTRDTAIVLLTLTRYLKISGELKTNAGYRVSLNGHIIAEKKVENVLTAPSTFDVDSRFIIDGENKLKVTRTSGKGPLYYSIQAQFFSKEEPISSTGNELFVRRQYHKLVGRPTLLKGYVYDKMPLSDGDTITSGDRIETVLTIESKNHYEYLIFEDLKPAGFEAVQIKSGGNVYARELKQGGVERRFSKSSQTKQAMPGLSPPDQGGMAREPRSIIAPPEPLPGDASDYTGRQRWVYQELRDRKVALFVDKLPQGVWEIRYNLRAEAPGKFHALPLMGHAMYIPEIRANGNEVRVTVRDRKNKKEHQ